MQKNELKEKYLELYSGITEAAALFKIITAVLRDNEGQERQTDLFPIANILCEKFDKLQDNSDYFMWELHERKLI